MTPAVFSAGILSFMPDRTKNSSRTGGANRLTCLNSALLPDRLI